MTAQDQVRERIAQMNAEVERLQAEATERLSLLADLLETRTYEASRQEAAMLLDVLKRLWRLSRDAAGLRRALGSSDE
jgi:hypothetical protein